MKESPSPPGPPAWATSEAGECGPLRRSQRTSRMVRVVLSVILSSFLFAFLFRLPANSTCFGHRFLPSRPRTIEERVKHILTHTPLIDGHNDLAILIRAYFNNHIYDGRFSKPFVEGGLTGHVDIPRLRAGMNGGAFWSVFIPCPANGTDFSDENYTPIVQQTLQQIDLLTRLRHSHPSLLSPPTLSPRAALHAFRSHSPPHLISPFGLEGLHHIGNSAATLRQFYSLGVRYATLTHNCHNRFADAALVETPALKKAKGYWGGVSPEGRKMVREMNRLGVIVDLAHASVDTMKDVLGAGYKDKDGDQWEGSAAPIMFSHSSAYSLCPHPRNVPDEVLDLVPQNGGVVMVNFNPGFVSCVEAPGREDGLPEDFQANATLAQVVRHVKYIGERIGWEHVGLGSDFDGIQEVPRGLEDVGKYPALVGELLRQGVRDEDVAKVVGRNVLRVWREVEKVAAEMQRAGEPVLEDDLPSVWAAGSGREKEKEL